MDLRIEWISKSNQTFEGGCDVGEIRYPSSDNENFSFRMVMSAQQSEDGFSVFVSLVLVGRSGIFSIVGQFVSAAEFANSVRIDNRGATASRHGPDAACNIDMVISSAVCPATSIFGTSIPGIRILC